MKNQNKTKEQLIDELVELRQQIAELKILEDELKQEKEEMKTSRNFFDRILNSIYEGVIVIGLDYKIREANDCFIKQYGKNREEVIGRYCYEVTHKSSEVCKGPLHLCPLESVFKTGEPFHTEHNHKDKEGKDAFVYISCFPLLRPDGEIESIVEISSDITERKQAEVQASVANERLQYLLSASPAVIYTAKPSDDYAATFISENVSQIVGYKPREFVENPSFWIDHVHPDDLQKVHDTVPRLFENSHGAYEYRFKHRNGNYIWVRDEMRLVRDEKGNPVEIVGYWADITTRKQAEEALRESEEKYRVLVENATDFVFMINRELKVLTLNKAAAKLLKKEPKEIIGKSILEIFPEQIAIGYSENLKKVFETGNPYSSEERMVVGKTETWINTSLNPVRDNEGKIIAVMGVTRDVTEYKQAEEALRKSEKRFRELVDLLPEMVFETDTKGNITFVNNAVIDGFGYSHVDFEKGLKTSQLTSPEDKEKHKDIFAERIEGREIGTTEYIAQRKDGSRFPVMVHSNVITDNERNVVGTRAIAMDITERKKAEEELENIFNLSPDMVAVFTTDGKLLKVNPSWEKVLGYTTKELLDMGWTKLVHPDDVERTNNEVEKQLKGSSVVNFVNRYKCKDGSYKTLEWQATFAKEGIVHATARDITERMQAEEELRESEEKYRQLFENDSDAVMIFDEQARRFEDANRATLDLYGYTREEFLKLQVTDLSAEPDKTKIAVDKIANGDTGSNVIPIRKHKKKDGTVFFSEISAGVFHSKGRKKIIGAVRDITERKKAEEEKERLQAQLIQSEKMAGIGTLTSGIAHEFNNLLQIMSGHSEFAQRTKKPEDMEEALEIVGNTSDRVSKIIKDLLSFSRREPLERKPCDITELAEFVLSMTEEQLNKNNIKVAREYGRVPRIEVNKGEIQQVFLNLVTNARDAMSPKGGKLEIGIKKVKDNVEISFTDTGIGIREEYLGKVFEPFYTTKGAVGGDTRIQGIGLGLSVSYGIVERHGGMIEVESEAGKETTFTIRLPAKVEKAKERAVKEKSKPKAKKTKPRSVLVVDDEEEICKMFTKWLSAEGHKVKSALTGKKALDLVKKESFDIVFLDIVMPGIPAIDTLAEIKEISLKTKIFMITGKLVDKDLWKELKADGAAGYIQKPFKIEDIKNCIAKLHS